MFTPKQFRAKATEYAELVEKTNIPEEAREFRRREQSFVALASNEEWLANNFEKTLHQSDQDREEGDGDDERQQPNDAVPPQLDPEDTENGRDHSRNSRPVRCRKTSCSVGL